MATKAQVTDTLKEWLSKSQYPTIQALADAAKLPRTTVSDVLTGRSFPSQATREKLYNLTQLNIFREEETLEGEAGAEIIKEIERPPRALPETISDLLNSLTTSLVVTKRLFELSIDHTPDQIEKAVFELENAVARLAGLIQWIIKLDPTERARLCDMIQEHKLIYGVGNLLQILVRPDREELIATQTELTSDTDLIL